MDESGFIPPDLTVEQRARLPIPGEVAGQAKAFEQARPKVGGPLAAPQAHDADRRSLRRKTERVHPYDIA